MENINVKLKKELEEKMYESIMGLCEHETIRHEKTHKGLADLKQELADFKTETNGRLSSVEGRLSSVEGRLSSVEGRLSNVESELSNVNGRLSNIEKDMQLIKQILIDMANKK